MEHKTEGEGWEFRITEMDLFTGLDLAVMGEIADAACTEAAFPQGTVVFSQGDSATSLFILVAGAVEIRVGNARTVYRLTGQSDIFGWSSLVESAQYTATAIATSETQTVCIDTRKMNRIFNAHPMVGLTVYRRLAVVFNKRLSSIYQRFLSV